MAPSSPSSAPHEPLPPLHSRSPSQRGCGAQLAGPPGRNVLTFGDRAELPRPSCSPRPPPSLGRSHLGPGGPGAAHAPFALGPGIFSPSLSQCPVTPAAQGVAEGSVTWGWSPRSDPPQERAGQEGTAEGGPGCTCSPPPGGSPGRAEASLALQKWMSGFREERGKGTREHHPRPGSHVLSAGWAAAGRTLSRSTGPQPGFLEAE